MIAISWGTGTGVKYHTGQEVQIKADGTVLCWAVDTDGKRYCDSYKMPKDKVMISVIDSEKIDYNELNKFCISYEAERGI